ncbi:phage tail assembly chaperone [Pelagibacterium sp.]|uniref:phage tail assembly chaperone n=1 Tax=Pelagibacterium sp. TaxID=1967288 RepID=UPI003A95BCC6
MPYAANGQISQSPIEGGVEISEAQYRDALEGMLQGKFVSISDGFTVELPPEPDPAQEPEPPTMEDLWLWLRSARNQRLTASDWVILRNLETSEPVPQAWLDYRQALRDLPDNTIDPVDPDWPEVPDL